MPEPILELRDLAKSYGAVEALRGVSLDVAEGSFVALVGASGSGKSTLLKTFNALIVPGTGSVSFEGEDVAALPDRRCAGGSATSSRRSASSRT